MIPLDKIVALKKWRVKASMAMFVITTTIEKELLEQEKDMNTSNELSPH